MLIIKGFKIPDDEAEKFVTVGDVVKFIKAHVEE